MPQVSTPQTVETSQYPLVCVPKVASQLPSDLFIILGCTDRLRTCRRAIRPNQAGAGLEVR